MKRLKIMMVLISSILTLTYGKPAKEQTTVLPTLSITLSKKQFLSGEPIIVNLKLTNKSSKPLPRLFGSNEDFASTADFTFTMRATDGSEVGRIQRHGPNVRRIVFKLLRPQEFWQCEQMFVPRMNLQKKARLDPNSPIPLLPHGLYKLTAKLLWNLPGKEMVFITSNSVEFQIKEPTGIDAEAAKLMESPEVGGFFIGFRRKSTAIATLLAKYPESTYASYARARFILGQGEYIWNTSRSAPTANKKGELALLVSNGLDYVEKNKDMPLNDNILLYCARMSRVLDREKESVQILNRIVKEFPQSDAAEAGRRQLEKWDRPLKAGEGAGLSVLSYVMITSAVGIVIAGLILLLKKKASSRGK
jgi:hypothetical protein